VRLLAIVAKWKIVSSSMLENFRSFTPPTSIVKAPNFGRHGNFGPLSQKGLLTLKRILQKNEENKSCRDTLDLQNCFCSYLVHDSSKEATEIAKNFQSFN
jgi:hypothetical protein